MYSTHYFDLVSTDVHCQIDVPTCGTDFHAVTDAKKRASSDTNISGCKVTGVAGLKCARHGFVERTDDLQKGERSVAGTLYAFNQLM
jgi:hypothetical protein